jgi:hypothetical protein
MMKAAVRSDVSQPSAPTTKRSAPDLEAVMRGAEEGRPVATRPQPAAKREPPVQNRPRLVVTDTTKLDRLAEEDEDEEEERSALLDDVAKTRGRPIETRKQSVVPTRVVEPEQIRAPAPRPQQDRRSDAPRQDRRPPNPSHRPSNNPRPAPRPQNPPVRPQGKPKRSVEDIFSEAEERTDRAITEHTDRTASHHVVSMDETEDRSGTVFRASGPRSLAPGQRIRFDE